jgi:hypothetical protein
LRKQSKSAKVAKAVPPESPRPDVRQRSSLASPAAKNLLSDPQQGSKQMAVLDAHVGRLRRVFRLEDWRPKQVH